MSDPTGFTAALDSSSDAQQRAADIAAKATARIQAETRRRLPELAAADPLPAEHVAAIEALEPFVDEFARAIAGVQVLRGLLNAGHLEFFPVGTIEGFRNLAYDAIKLTSLADPGERNAAANRAADLARQLLGDADQAAPDNQPPAGMVAEVKRLAAERDDLERGMAETARVAAAEAAAGETPGEEFQRVDVPNLPELERAAPLVLFDVYPATINQHELADAIAELAPSFTSASTSASGANQAYGEAVAYCQANPASGWVIVRTWAGQAPHVAGVVGVDGIVDTGDELEPAIEAGLPGDFASHPDRMIGTQHAAAPEPSHVGPEADLPPAPDAPRFAVCRADTARGLPHHVAVTIEDALAYCDGASGTPWDIWQVEHGRDHIPSAYVRIVASIDAAGEVTEWPEGAQS